jgi:ubiquinone/menaquinone biosynthesis C-methylase UbiE
MIKNNTQEHDFDPYQPSSIPLFEAIYGEHLISLGGLAAIDNMFEDLNINGLKALDLGFGLGGVAFYLAEKYQMNIKGIELHPWMVQYAQEHAPENIAVEFATYDAAGQLPYPPASFDLVYSKGVLNHVTDKNNLFQQINAVLKPAGLLVIADWIFPKTIATNNTPLVCESKSSYTEFLLDTGFGDITFRDDSKLFLLYAQELLKRLALKQKFIEQQYSQSLYITLREQHEELIEKIKHQQKIAMRIVAKKTAS